MLRALWNWGRSGPRRLEHRRRGRGGSDDRVGKRPPRLPAVL